MLMWHDLPINHKNYNFLDCDWFKMLLFSTNSLAKLSDSLLLDSLLLDSLLLDSLLLDIPLTNRVRGPYYKLRILVFLSSIYCPSAKRTGHKSKKKNEDP